MGKLAHYFRISLEDMNKQHQLIDESHNITSQRKIVQEYTAKHSAFTSMETVEFFDDGYSGTNFDRPQFIAMMKAVRRGEIKCIIVKDLSRFGRNYIEVGDYLEHIFPFLGVRFISVTDGYDSNDYIGKTGGMDVAFRNFVYDSYSKDLSVKVRSAMHTRMENGRFVNHTPYGYTKLPTDKHQMIPDPETAPIVREIFLKAISGKSTSDIAKDLNARGIPTPLEYKKHRLKPACTDRQLMWSHTKILNILHNYRYTGAMTNHTRECRYMRDPNQRRVPREEWIITEGAHEAIVSHAEYEAAQNAIRKVRYAPHKTGDTSDRVFFCGHCGRKLRKTFGLDTYFSCDTPMYQEDAACSGIRWSKTDLEEVLLPIYQTQLQLLDQRVNASCAQTPARSALHFTQEIARIEKSIAACDTEKVSLYERYREGGLSREAFVKQKGLLTDQQQQLRERREKEDAALRQWEKDQTEEESAHREAEKYLTGLTAAPEQVKQEMYAAIERVRIFSNTHIAVEWKFADLFREMDTLLDNKKEREAV